MASIATGESVSGSDFDDTGESGASDSDGG